VEQAIATRNMVVIGASVGCGRSEVRLRAALHTIWSREMVSSRSGDAELTRLPVAVMLADL